MSNGDLIDKIEDVAKRAKTLVFKEKFKAAIDEYKNGLALLGQQPKKSEFAVMLFSGIGDTYFLQNKWNEALEAYTDAVSSEGGLGDPGIHFRLGQIRFNLGDLDKAKDELMRAYMGSGDIIFEGEDRKYFDLIREYVDRKR